MIPEFSSRALDGGSRLHTLSDPRFKEVFVQAGFRIPLGADAGVVALCAATMLRGTRSCPDTTALARRGEELYGARVDASLTRSGENLGLLLSVSSVAGCRLPDDPLPGALALLEEVLMDPPTSGNTDILEEERAHHLNYLRSLRDDRGAWARHRALQVMCEGEPYQFDPQGDEETVAAATQEDVEAVRGRMASNASLDILAAGDLDAEAMAQWAAGWTDRMGRSDLEALSEPVPVEPGAVRTVEESVVAEQARLVLGYRKEAGGPLTLADRVAAQVVGGGPTSKLFREVREKKSLAYSIYASGHRGKGLVMVEGGVSAESAEEACAEAQLQWTETADGRITEEELGDVRRAWIRGLNRAADRPAGLLARARMEAWVGTGASPAEEVAALETVTLDQVAEAAGGFTLDTVFRLVPEAGA